jgi:hypothetical protein
MEPKSEREKNKENKISWWPFGKKSPRKQSPSRNNLKGKRVRWSTSLNNLRKTRWQNLEYQKHSLTSKYSIALDRLGLKNKVSNNKLMNL